jgi:hypothetical protein
MRDNGKAVVCILSSLMLCTGVKATAADAANPYQGIVDRNVFGLKPPPPPPKTEPDRPPLPPITLTGITTILGNKRALMNVQMPGGKLQSFILAENVREGEIEVLEIDEKIGSVKVNAFGSETNLTFEKNGTKLAAAPAPVPGVPGNPGFPQQPGSYNPAGAPAPGLKTIPTRTLRLPGAAATPAGQPSSGIATPTPNFSSAQPPSPVPSINPDEQALHMLTQHVQNTDRGIEMPPLPPPLAEALQGPNAQPAPTPVPQNNRFNPPRAPGLPQTPPLPQ